ncbi:MAG: hypothetical protein ACTHMW_10075 [Actinomycetes bacterium]
MAASGSSELRVILESGPKRTFAAAVDWPGWCRLGRTEEDALEVLAAYAGRYADALSVTPDGRDLIAATPLGQLGDGELPPTATFVVVERLTGNRTTDFGAPDARATHDHEPLSPNDAARLAVVLEAAWACFDAVVAESPEELAKGPRGGGRDTSRIVEHVREAERAYARKWAARVPAHTPWPEQRDAIRSTLRGEGGLPPDDRWPVRYSVRRTVWHVLDHAWEIEDRR